MLLNRILGRVRRDEQGVALIAVIGVMAVGVVVGSVILTSILSGIGFTASTRAGVQSQAGADAGLAAVQAGLQIPGDCVARSSQYTPDVVVPGLEYVATVWIPNASAPEGWIRGCPSTPSMSVRVISEGVADAKGVAGNDQGDESYVEAIFGAIPASVVEGPSASAVYTGSGGSISSLTVSAGAGSPGDIHILKGNFNCNSGSVISGSIVVADGDLDITNACTIGGSAKASGSVKITSSVSVAGDVVAAGGPVNLTNTGIRIGGSVYAAGLADIHATVEGGVEATGAVTIQSGGLIKQSVVAGGKLTISGRVNGNATTPSTAVTQVDPNSMRVAGSLRVGGAISTWGYAWNVPSEGASDAEKAAYHLVTKGWVGSIAYNQPGLTGPLPKPAPTVTPWVDFEYDHADWAGFAYLKWPASAGCGVGNWNFTTHPIYSQIQNLTMPTVIDTRECDIDIRGGTLAVKTDITFVGKKTTLGTMKFTASDGADHRMWFLVPDANPSAAGANCTAGSDIITDGATEFSANIVTLAYTPCKISMNNGTKWRGQLYSGSFAVSSGDSLVYMPIGIPGTDLSGGATPGGPVGGGSARLGDPISIRNRLDDGVVTGP